MSVYMSMESTCHVLYRVYMYIIYIYIYTCNIYLEEQERTTHISYICIYTWIPVGIGAQCHPGDIRQEHPEDSGSRGVDSREAALRREGRSEPRGM